VSQVDELLREAVRDTDIPPLTARWSEIERAAAGLRRRRRIRRGLALGGASLALAALLLLAGGLTGGSGPSPLERASAAVTAWPPNQILHTRIRLVSHFDQPVYLEDVWQLTSPPYTERIVNSFDDGVPADTVDSVWDANGNGQVYDSGSNRLLETTDVRTAWRPTDVVEGGQTRDEMQGWVANSHATSLGESDVDGHHVLGFEAFGDSRIFVDATTYLPVLSQSFGIGVGDQRNGYDQHYTWDLLPATPANLPLLDLTAQHPDASTATLAGPAWADALLTLNRASRTLITPGA
jgi:hypothetical protein